MSDDGTIKTTTPQSKSKPTLDALQNKWPAVYAPLKLSERYKQDALDRCMHYETSLETILHIDARATPATLARQQAAYYNVRYVNLRQTPCDLQAVYQDTLETVLQQQAIGWRTAAGKAIYATPNITFARKKLPENTRLAVVTRKDFDREVQRVFEPALLRDASNCTPTPWSARARPPTSRVGRICRALLGFVAVAVLAYLCIWHTFAVFSTTAIALTLFVAIMSVFRGLLLFGAITTDKGAARAAPNVVAFKRPCITILIPVYREENGIAAIIKSLSRIAYPRELLDVILVIEQADTLTRNAITEAKLPRWMREITVPYSLPQTKPKAMNYALHFARGSIVGVYDAEDAPHPQQINKVVEMFAQSTPDVACVQARLGYYNANECWLTRCFAIEYAIWFDVLMKGVRALDLPIPLGGTSVFFRKTVLETLGKWDAANVTEDADLGMRLYRQGFRTELVDCLTLEEATCKVSHWITQRSRWLKGFLQSWMTCMRAPHSCLQELGTRQFLGMTLLLLGAVLSFLAQPIFWGTAAVWAFTDVVWWSGTLGRTLEWTIIIILSCGQLVTLACAWQALKRRQSRWLFPWAFTLPFYWPLGGIAAYKAVYCFLKNPSFWAKTPHGITKHTPDNPHAS